MTYVSALLRLVSGLALMGCALFVYLVAKEDMEKGAVPVLFGHQLGVTSEMLSGILIAVGLIGGLLVVFGVVTMLRKNVTQ